MLLHQKNVLVWSVETVLSGLIGAGAVAFITLLERKILSFSQYRLGPNKTSLGGVLQPVSDGVKLLAKDAFNPLVTQELLFLFSPLLLFFMFLFMWSFILPWEGSLYYYKSSALVLFCFLGGMAYSVIMAGWSTTSPFSKLGSMRGILQSLSYEVALILAFLWPLMFMSKLSFKSSISLELSLGWVLIVLLFVLMEGNRAPFDLLEGESELISGFNIEMGSLMFVFLFLSEYGMILFMGILLSKILLDISWVLFLLLVSLLLIFRSCYPRTRYDSLMGLMWKSLLPTSVMILCWVLLLK